MSPGSERWTFPVLLKDPPDFKVPSDHLVGGQTSIDNVLTNLSEGSESEALF